MTLDLSPRPETVPAPGDIDAALNRLRHWQAQGVELGFVYLRTHGGLMSTGRVHLIKVSDSTLALRSAGTQFVIRLKNALFSVGEQLFSAAGHQGTYLVPGVSVRLDTQDWLFLTDAAPAGELALSAPT